LGLISDDIAGICQEMRWKLPCNMVFVASEIFAYGGESPLIASRSSSLLERNIADELRIPLIR